MDHPSKKKAQIPVSKSLRNYLYKYDRARRLPVCYEDLLRFEGSFALHDKNGEDTLWRYVTYSQSDLSEIKSGLTLIYSLLKTDGDLAITEHLSVDRIDYCTFGNSNPFRVRIVNQFNDNYDYFYVKQADASRIYGLELEHLLSPNMLNYMVFENTLVEEHILGIPGDVFILNYLHRPVTNKVRIAKEFVKFNERCFVRLLGDMRAYNYVVDITPDFEEEQYRVRAIDFDQQSYEGRRTMYLPQFFKGNNPIVAFCVETMTPETIRQYQYEERTLIYRRFRSEHFRFQALKECLTHDRVSTPAKVKQLKAELNTFHKTERFDKCKSMGDVLYLNLRLCLEERP